MADPSAGFIGTGTSLFITVIVSLMTRSLFNVAPEHPESVRKGPVNVLICPDKAFHDWVALIINLPPCEGSGYRLPFLVLGPGISSNAFLFIFGLVFNTVPFSRKDRKSVV